MARLPTESSCRALIEQLGMMPHIIDHSSKVRDVARFLCRKLAPSNPDLDCCLVETAALLHDITKTRSFSTGEKHSESGGLLLTELGYREIGSIVRQHVVLDTYTDTGPVTEAEIVNYSDKRVLHDRIVSLDHRMHYILETYGTTEENRLRIRSLQTSTYRLETKLFLNLSITPDSLEKLDC